jgi:TPR repeat protein
LREAADEGNARALFEIGWMTYFGLGCRRSVSEARRLVETAVDRGILNTLTGESVTGNPYSQLRLGWL